MISGCLKDDLPVRFTAILTIFSVVLITACRLTDISSKSFTMSLPKYFSALLLAISFITTEAQEGFRLTGTAPASLEGSMIYIGTIDYSGIKQEFKDSARIGQGRFTFTGRLPQTAMLTSLSVKQPKFGLHQFFLENRNMTVTIHATGAKNALDSCTFTNAPVHEQFMLLKKKLKPTDSLTIRQYQKMDTAMAKADEMAKQQMNNELMALFRQSKQVTVKFIKENPNNYLSLYQLCYFIAGGPMEYADSLHQLLTHLSIPLQQQPEAIALLKRIQQSNATRIGQPAPWTVLPTEQNIPLSLNSYKGKYVLLDFWASWCGPCLQNLPAVKELYNTWHTGNFDIVGISLDDDKQKWTDAIKKHNLSWVQASDLKGWKNAVAMLYDIRSIPQYILIDPSGKIIANSNDIAPIKQQLEKSLKQSTILKQ